MNLNDSLNRYTAECKHPETQNPGSRLVCKTCAIAWSTKWVEDEIEVLFNVITQETGHLTLASLLNEFKSLRALHEKSNVVDSKNVKKSD